MLREPAPERLLLLRVASPKRWLVETQLLSRVQAVLGKKSKAATELLRAADLGRAMAVAVVLEAAPSEPDPFGPIPLPGADHFVAAQGGESSSASAPEDKASRLDRVETLVQFELKDPAWPLASRAFQRRGRILRHVELPCVIGLDQKADRVVCSATARKAAGLLHHVDTLTARQTTDADIELELNAGSFVEDLGELLDLVHLISRADYTDERSQGEALGEDLRIAALGELLRTTRDFEGLRVEVRDQGAGKALSVVARTRFAADHAWPVALFTRAKQTSTRRLESLLERLAADASYVAYGRRAHPDQVEDIRRWLRAALAALPDGITRDTPELSIVWPWVEAPCLGVDWALARSGRQGDEVQPVDRWLASYVGWNWLALADGGQCFDLLDESLALAFEYAKRALPKELTVHEGEPWLVRLEDGSVLQLFAYHLRLPAEALDELWPVLAEIGLADVARVQQAAGGLWFTLSVGRGRGATWVGLGLLGQEGPPSTDQGVSAALRRALEGVQPAPPSLLSALRRLGAPSALGASLRPFREADAGLGPTVVRDDSEGWTLLRTASELVEASTLDVRRDGRAVVIEYALEVAPDWRRWVQRWAETFELKAPRDEPSSAFGEEDEGL